MKRVYVPGKISCGELEYSATAVQMPNIPATWIMLHAPESNTGPIIVGAGADVTDADGSTNTTAGFKVEDGASTEWMPLVNLERLWYFCETEGDSICYVVLD